jgi:hypothetical protein
MSCAADVGTIDRTQHEKLEKKKLQGVWFLVQTVTDIPANLSLTFVGEMNFGGTAKLLWDIQEKMLIGYPVTESIHNSEKKWHKQAVRKYWDDSCMVVDSYKYDCVETVETINANKKCCFIEMYLGQPLVAYEIESHFDVFRDYNPQTGEQTNVLVENTTDKKWYERKYMRVNWSANMINDYTFMARLSQQNSVDYWVQSFDKDNPDAPTFTDDYFDIVNKVFIEPEYPEGCNIYGLSQFDCVGGVVKIRNAFRKADHNSDYEPLRFHNEEQMSNYGFFLTEKYTYDEDYGTVYTGKFSLINRWNIWNKTRQNLPIKDNDGKEITKTCIKDLKDTGCDVDAGEFCVAGNWFEKGTCTLRQTLPYTMRGIRPILYFKSPNWPEYYDRELYELADQWDNAYKETVSWLYFWEEKQRIYGQWQTKLCNTDADCSSHALYDNWINFCEKNYVSCDSGIDNYCGQGSCGGDGFCLKKDGSTLVRDPSKTIVLTNGEDDTKIFAYEIDDESIPDLLSTYGAVKFLNATNKNVDFFYRTKSGKEYPVFEDVAFNLNQKLHPYKIFSSDVYEFVVKVRDTEQTVRLTNAEITDRGISTFVFTADEKLVRFDANKFLSAGIRVINVASLKDGKPRSVEVAVNGSNRSFFVADESTEEETRIYTVSTYEASPYLKLGGYYPQKTADTACAADASGNTNTGKIRITIINSGDRTDVTCFQSENTGRCVGWKPQLTDQDRSRVAEIKNSLPRIYMVCQNVYNGSPEDPGKGKYDVMNDDKNWGDYNGDGKKTNPCKEVADADKIKKIGDIRYSFLYWIPEDQSASPLGYGPSATDPDTGEIFYGVANIYGAYIISLGQYLKDIIDLLNGNLSTKDFTTGEHVKKYLKEKYFKYQGLSTESVPLTFEEGSASLPGEDDADFTNTGKKIDKTGHAKSDKVPDPKTMLEILKYQKDRDLVKNIIKAKFPGAAPGDTVKKLSKLKGSYIEDLMITNEIKLAFTDKNSMMNDYIDESQKQEMSPLNWMTFDNMVRKEREKQIFLGKHAFDRFEFNDEALLGLARKLGCTQEEKQKKLAGDPAYKDRLCLEGDELRLEGSKRYLGATAEHEVGHTVGLRHNFEGSADLFNFLDEYYTIREKEPVPCASDGECEESETCGCGEKNCAGKQKYCYREISEIKICKENKDCGDAEDVACSNEKKCYSFTICASDWDCGEGETCSDWDCGDGKKCKRCVNAAGNIVNKPIIETSNNVALKLIPRAGLTPSESINQRTEYQYSSIMDYGQRMNSDIHGLGKWDIATIKYGYGQLVEVYADRSRLDQAIKANMAAYSTTEEDASGSVLDTSWWNWGVYLSQFYFLNDYIGIEQNLKRDTVPYEHLKLEQDMVVNYFRQMADVTYIPVPYKFCPDEYVGNVGCYTWDTGVDISEIVHNNGILLKDYYMMDAFKRDRMWFGYYGSYMSYFSRIMDRWLGAFQDSCMYYALFSHLLRNAGWIDQWRYGTMLGSPLREACEYSFNYLAKLLASPAPGSFKLNTEENIFENYSYDNDKNADLTIPLGDGQYPYTKFLDYGGYFDFEHAEWIGSFWNKMGALLTLTDSTVYFTTNYVGEQLDIGVGTSIGFNTIYQKELSDLLGGIIADEYDRFAWVVDKGKYTPVDFFADSDTYKDLPRIKPSLTNLTMKIFSAVYGTALLPAGFDPFFIDTVAVCWKGHGDCYDIAKGAGLETVEFQDPFSGKIFLAWISQYDPERLNVSFRILEKLNDLKKKWEDSTDDAEKEILGQKIRDQVEVIDLLRIVWETFGVMKI